MIAEKYGYWISPRLASKTANTPAAIERMYAGAEKARKDTRRGYVFIGIIIGLAACLILGLITRHFLGVVLGALIGLIFITAEMMATAIRKGRRAESLDTKYIVPVLKHHPWQTWLCVVEGMNGNPNSYLKLMHLMSSQQEVVKVFSATMPQNVWWSLTDGMGVFPWVRNWVKTSGSPIRTRSKSLLQWATQIFQDVASAATSSAVQRLLGG